MQFITKKEYMEQFQKTLEKAGTERKVLAYYLDAQFQKINQLTEAITHETFWRVFPEILGIDAKLSLLTELISCEDFSSEEIIRITETDYRTYLKELCGYNISEGNNPSMVFKLV